MRAILIFCCLVSVGLAQTSQPALVDRGDLHRLAKVFARAESGHMINIAVLGGSITQGYAASKPENRYANRLVQWWLGAFPKGDATLLNAGIGATGSEYGCLRVQRDVLTQSPDLVILEFSVNDPNTEAAARTYEGVVRQILSAPNHPALILLFMTQEDGTTAQPWHEKIGRHYKLPMVSYHDAIFDQLKRDGLTWKDISPDNIHPNDKGMAYVAKDLSDFLTSIKDQRPSGDATSLPSPLLSDVYAHTALAEAEGLAPTTQSGWTLDNANHCWTATQPGSVFEVEVPGSSLSLMYYKIHKDFGRARVTVDDSPPRIADGWFDQTWGGKRETMEIAHDLKGKTHHVKIELLDEKSDASNGHEFRILGIGSAGVATDAGDSSTGPYTWHNAQIVGGGFVSGIVPHPTEKGLMYAKTDIGGAYRRTATEKDWTPITDWIDAEHWTWTGIESVAIDPNDAQRVYVAGGSYTNAWSGNGAILRSADQGNTWQVTPMPFKMGGNENGRGMGERLMVDPHDGNVLMFGSRKNGLWRSDDRGANWKAVDSFPMPNDTGSIGACCVFFDGKPQAQGKQTVLIGTGSKQQPIFRSDDGGQTWRALDGAPKGLLPHHVAQDQDGSIYVTFGNGPGPNEVTAGAVYKLNLADDSFTDISPVKPSEQDKFGYAGVTVDPQHGGTVMVSTLDRWAKTDELFRSRDGGKTWIGLRDKTKRDWSIAPWLLFDKDSVGIGHWISDIEIDPADDNHLLYCTGWGMWETRDLKNADKNANTHWKIASKGIEEVVTNDLISPPDGAHLLSAMWDIDGFRHGDLNKSTQSFKPNYGGNTSIDFADAKPNMIVRVYGEQPVGGSAGGGNGGSISDDGGKTWTPFVTRPSDDCKSGSVAVSSNGNTIVWAPEKQPAIVTHDRGATWKPCGGMPAKVRVTSDREDSAKFYATDSENGTVLLSRDNGETFEASAKDLPKGESYLAAVPGKTGEVWLATNQGLMVSYDAARSFKAVGGFAYTKRVGFGRPRHDDDPHPAIFVVGKRDGIYGFYRSDDRGKSWTRINDDQHQFGEITAIIGDPRTFGRVYVASRNRGVIYGEPK